MPRDHLHLRTLKRMIGVVVSTAMDRTAIVAIPRLRMHRRTQKIVKQTTRFFCHDHHEVCGVGDKVEIKFCGQVSKKKFWAVIDVLQRFPQLEGEPFPQSFLKNPPPLLARSQAPTGAAAAGAAAAAAAPAAPLR
jgi:small subunit ribosomal protein S17